MIKLNSTGLYTIVRREVMRFCRIWTQTLLPSTVSTLLYFIVFGRLIGSRIGNMEQFTYIEYIIPGLVMMSMITNSYMNVSSSVFISKFQRNIEEMLISPLSNNIILWGYVIGGLLRGVIVGILVTMVALFFVKLRIYSLSIVSLIGFLTALLFAIAGFINGILAKKFDDIDIIPTFILTPLIYLGGVFYSIHLLPSAWQKVMHVNPIFYMINSFRFGMLGHSDVDVRIALSVIIIFIISLYCFAIWLLNRGVGIKT